MLQQTNFNSRVATITDTWSLGIRVKSPLTTCNKRQSPVNKSVGKREKRVFTSHYADSFYPMVE